MSPKQYGDLRAGSVLLIDQTNHDWHIQVDQEDDGIPTSMDVAINEGRQRGLKRWRENVKCKDNYQDPTPRQIRESLDFLDQAMVFHGDFLLDPTRWGRND
jgi:hypothetical protein